MGLVLWKRAADEDAYILPNDAVLRDSCVLEGFEGALQEEPLLRVHRDGFLLGEPEEWGIESGEVDIEEVAADRIHGATFSRVRVMKTSLVESLFGDLGKSRSGSSAEFPKLGGGGNASWHAASHAHDRNGDGLQASRTTPEGAAIGKAIGSAVRVPV